MKKVIEDLASKNGLSTGYSGTLRILYIKGEKNHEFIQHVKKLYPNLAFQLKAAVDAPKIQTFSGSDVNFDLAATVSEQAYETVFGPGNPLLSDETGQANFEEKAKPTFQEVDLYLLANPVDRKAKGPYNAAAEYFGVKPDYIRKRWASLRERKLVEQDNVNA
jgi:hypothetical protein